MNYKKSQLGFTLVELVIAVMLGLLVVAAVTQIYVMAVRTASTQKAAAGILDANVYGMQQVERSLRMAGLGFGGISRLNSVCSGILIANTINKTDLIACPKLTGIENNPDGTSTVIQSPIADLSLNYWTKSTHGISNVQVENAATGQKTSIATPQVTIQYRAPVHMRDCEGNLALGPRGIIGVSAARVSKTDSDIIRIDGQVIVERYFVKRNGDKLELRCDAGRYVAESIKVDMSTDGVSPSSRQDYENAKIIGDDKDADGTRVLPAIKDIGDNGALVIADIDDFQIQLGTKSTGGIQYYSIDDFIKAEEKRIADAAKDPTKAEPPLDIVALRMAILAKGLVSAPKGDVDNPSYKIFGNTVTIDSNKRSLGSIRRVYETTTMLRNSRGDE